MVTFFNIGFPLIANRKISHLLNKAQLLVTRLAIITHISYCVDIIQGGTLPLETGSYSSKKNLLNSSDVNYW